MHKNTLTRARRASSAQQARVKTENAAASNWDALTFQQKEERARQVLVRMRDRAAYHSDEYEALLHASVLLDIRIEERAAKGAHA